MSVENRKKALSLVQKVPDNPSKIAVVGLAGVGKTCLLKTLFHEFDEIDIIEPTHNIERSMTEFLVHPLSIWDFGGQLKYTRNYLSSPHKYFHQISQLFFIVDVQNTDKIQEAIDYFNLVVSRVNLCNPNTHITIIYNKFDPIFPDPLVLSSNLEKFKIQALMILKSFGFGYQAFRTSFYAPMLVMTAFSKSMLENPAIYDEISSSLAKFANIHKIDGAIVFTPQGFGLGYYISEKLKKIELRELFIKFFTKIEQMYDLMPMIQLDFQGMRIYSARFFIITQSRKIPIFFGFIYQNSLPDKESIANFIKTLKRKIRKIQFN